MTGLSALALGLGLGLRHATDADHVVVVSTLLEREPGPFRAARVAVSWGAGHTATFFGLGLSIVLLGVRVPDGFERAAELVVALMLIGFGGWHLWQNLRTRRHGAAAPTGAGRSLVRPALVGVVHGLAGSAGTALIASTTIASPAVAVAYLALFGLGTVLGMVLLTVLLSWPLGWTARRSEPLRRATSVAAALLSLGLGAFVLFELLASQIGA